MGFSLNTEWDLVFSHFQDYSQYSSWSYQCCSLDGIDSATDFQFLQFYQLVLWKHSKSTNYNCYNFNRHITQLFHFSDKVQQLFLYLFPFVYFPSVVSRNEKYSISQLLLFLLKTTRSCLLSLIKWSSESQNPSELCVASSKTDSGFCIFHLVAWSNLIFFFSLFPVDHPSYPDIPGLEVLFC